MKIATTRVVYTIPEKIRKKIKDPKKLAKYIVKKNIKEHVELSDKLISKTIAVIDEISERSYIEAEGKYRNIIIFPIIPFPVDPFNQLRCLRECEEEHGHWLPTWMLTRLADVIKEREEIITTLSRLALIKISEDPETNYEEGMFKSAFYYIESDSFKLSKLRHTLVSHVQKLDDDHKKKAENLTLNSKRFFTIGDSKVNYVSDRQHHILEFLWRFNNDEYHNVTEMRNWWIKQPWYKDDLPKGYHDTGASKVETFFRSGVQKIREKYGKNVILSKKNIGYRLNPANLVELIEK